MFSSDVWGLSVWVCNGLHHSGLFVYEGDWSGPVSVGCVAGDAQSYILFCDFFDRIIEAHHEHKITSQTPESDFNYDNLKVAALSVAHCRFGYINNR